MNSNANNAPIAADTVDTQTTTAQSHARTRQPQPPPVDYLNLPGLRTLAEPVHGKSCIWVQAEQIRLTSCPECGCQTKQFKANGTRKQVLLDEPRGALSVRIELRRRCYKCRACDSSNLQPLACAAEKRRMTRRLEQYIQQRSFLRPCAEVAQETGVSDRTVREIFEKAREARDRAPSPQAPRVLGIDGVYIRKRERAILADPENRLVLDIGTGVTKPEVIVALKKLPAYEQVEVVTMDMARALREAVMEVLPQAIIVIDRYHIQRLANQALDSVRIRITKMLKDDREAETMCNRKLLRKHRTQLTEKEAKDLEQYFTDLSDTPLKEAYERKEEFFAIWHGTKTSAEARAEYNEWLARVPLALYDDFEELLTAMANWDEFIFNYFDYPYTNAFTEASNRRIKDIQREGRACSFETVRAKAIHGTRIRQELKVARKEEAGLRRRLSARAHKQVKRGAAARAAARRARGCARPRLPTGRQMSLFHTGLQVAAA